MHSTVIEAWISDVVFSQPFDASPPPAGDDEPLATHTRKRKATQVPTTHAPRKSRRLALQETSANIANSTPIGEAKEPMPRMREDVHGQTDRDGRVQDHQRPQRGRTRRQTRQIRARVDDNNPDHDVTPRPIRIADNGARHPVPAFDRPSLDAQVPGPKPVRRANSASEDQSSLSTDSRRSSPSKKPTYLQNLRQPILQTVPQHDEELAAGVLDLPALWPKMHDIADGVRIVPVGAFEQVKNLDPAFRDATRQIFDKTPDRTRLGRLPDIDFVRKITYLTNECIRDTTGEHGWNSFVHGPLLTEALWSSVHKSSVAIKDVSTCAIQPTTLLPPASGAYKVDYAMVLTSNAVYHTSLQNLDPLAGAEPSFNATADPALASTPTCIGIEAKPAGEGGNKGGTQLSVWACATLNRLRQLQAQFGRPRTAIAELPLFLVQGETWKFRVAHIGKDGTVTIYHHPKDLGSTANAKGVLSILMALQVLADWAVQEWRPWFNENVLPRAVNS